MKKIIIILVVLLAVGCKAKEAIRYVEVPTLQTRIDSVEIQRVDSFVQWQKGDTVFQSKVKYEFRDRIKIQIDSVSVPFEVVKIEQVEKIVVKYKFGLTDWLWLLLATSLLFAAYFGIKKLTKIF